jgi:hypothetical protein
MFTRRDFLRSSPLIALAPTLPAFLAKSARAMVLDRHEKILLTAAMML